MCLETGMTDQEREKLIQDMQFKIVFSRDIKQTQKYFEEQKKLIAGRSEKQIAKMEIEKGLV